MDETGGTVGNRTSEIYLRAKTQPQPLLNSFANHVCYKQSHILKSSVAALSRCLHELLLISRKALCASVLLYSCCQGSVDILWCSDPLQKEQNETDG